MTRPPGRRRSPTTAADASNLFTRAELEKTLGRLGLQPRCDIFPDLEAAYGAADRHYHTARHISECLRHFAANRHLAIRAPEIEIALWFHDAIYDTHRADNEARSAAWAANHLGSEGLDAASVHRIEALILATRHDGRPGDGDQQLLVDVDLGILGQPASVFDAYDVAIRQEYDWVPEPEYRRARVAVLSHFLDRERIYGTDRFFELYEAQARHNIARAIAVLESKPGDRS